LVLRLAGLLWRLRRTTRVEADLFNIQAVHLRDLKGHDTAQTPNKTGDIGQHLVQSGSQPSFVVEQGKVREPGNANSENDDLARCYLRLAHLPSFALDRLEPV
jgi:hypothetical protein